MRLVGFIGGGLLALTLVGTAAAQLLAPLPAAPPAPTGAAERALGDAYLALVRAGVSNPALAQQANFAYQTALARYRAGDLSAAVAAAALASSVAGSAGVAPPPSFPPARYPSLPLGVRGLIGPQGSERAFPPATAVPLAGEADLVPLPLYVARKEIELVERVTGERPLEAARRYRVALDAYLSGDAARMKQEANAAFGLAADALERYRSRR